MPAGVSPISALEAEELIHGAHATPLPGGAMPQCKKPAHQVHMEHKHL